MAFISGCSAEQKSSGKSKGTEEVQAANDLSKLVQDLKRGRLASVRKDGHPDQQSLACMPAHFEWSSPEACCYPAARPLASCASAQFLAVASSWFS